MGVLLGIVYLRRYRRETEGTPDAPALCEVTGDACFGGEHCHLRRSLKAERSFPEYYEDEELDRFRGRMPGEYTPEETAEWEEILSTLRPGEVVGWIGSIHRRGLRFPERLRPRLKALTEQ